MQHVLGHVKQTLVNSSLWARENSAMVKVLCDALLTCAITTPSASDFMQTYQFTLMVCKMKFNSSCFCNVVVEYLYFLT